MYFNFRNIWSHLRIYLHNNEGKNTDMIREKILKAEKNKEIGRKLPSKKSLKAIDSSVPETV
jgi:hypothetical protein